MILKRLYKAHGSDGKEYEVHVYAEPAGEAAHHHEMAVEHLSLICISTGEKLRVLGHGHYEIIDTGVILRSGDSQAI